jgi:hypothetical protein
MTSHRQKTQNVMSNSKAGPAKPTGSHTRTHRSVLFSRKAVKHSASTMVSSSDCPFIIEFVMVEGINFKCMAYLDQNDIWRNAYNNTELMEPIRVLG